ncbi:uncharacterized protein LOC135194601 [Vanessa tameamea]|uniref:Uncharacterized protein LOC135194601 n=1 Tax=Vanessa tameamea TaxID=334116 RepID=A0ABM4AY98_VANTA
MSESSESVKSAESQRSGHVTVRRARKTRMPMDVGAQDGSSPKCNLKVPPFSPEDPELWFALLEGIFESFNIVDDRSKFSTVITSLDIPYAKSVKDIIINPPAKNRYGKIKMELIRRLSASHEKKVKQLLTHEELGDRKPSQFLRHLQDLAGPSVPDDFVKSIWSNRLPPNIQTVLASQPTHWSSWQT